MQTCKYEEDIGYIKGTLKSLDIRINGSMDKIAHHIKQGSLWRISIVGVVFAGILQVVSFAYLFGMLTSTVNHNKVVVDKYIEKHALQNQKKGV